MNITTKQTVQVSTTIKAPTNKVWQALIDPQIVKKYLFSTNLETNWIVGQPIFFRGTWEKKSYEDKGIVLEFTPKKFLKYSYWSSFSGKPDRPENYQFISYLLEDLIDKTHLTILQENTDLAAKEHSEQNWKAVLDSLKKILE